MKFSVDFIGTNKFEEIGKLVESFHAELRPLDINEYKYRVTFRSRNKALAFIESFDTHHYGHIEGEIKEELPRTAQIKVIVEGDKAYNKCPFCDYMVFDPYYDPKSELRMMVLGPDETKTHIRQVHGLYWMSTGGKGRWHRIRESKPQEEGQDEN